MTVSPSPRSNEDEGASIHGPDMLDGVSCCRGLSAEIASGYLGGRRLTDERGSRAWDVGDGGVKGICGRSCVVLLLGYEMNARSIHGT